MGRNLRYSLTLAMFVCGLVCSCGPKVKISPEINRQLGQSVAVLPAEYADGVQRERIDYLHELLRLELANSGFLVLDPRLVGQVCSNTDCNERELLVKKFGVKRFAKLRVDSNSQVDFLAGYYNSLSGILDITDPQGVSLFVVEHTEREKGGVVFESGQVFQGIVSQIRNREPDSFNAIGVKFVKKLTSKIPPPMGEADLGSSAGVRIDLVETRRIRDAVEQVCLNGSPGGVAVVRFGLRQSSLREVSPGMYCAIFRREQALFNNGSLTAELRSPFGLSVKREVSQEQLQRLSSQIRAERS